MPPIQQTCITQLTAGDYISVGSCSAGTLMTFDATVPFQQGLCPTGVPTPTASTEAQVFTASAPLIQINWRSEDRAAAPMTMLNTIIASVPSDSSTGGPPQQSGSRVGTEDASEPATRKGPIAGIAIGATALLVLLCLGSFLLLRQQRKRKKAALEKGAPVPKLEVLPDEEINTVTAGTSEARYELSGLSTAELPCE